MRPKRIEDVLKSQQIFSQQMQQQMQQFSQQTGSTIATPDKLEQLQQYEQRLLATTEAKATAIRRYDKDIQRYQKAIARLRTEIKSAETHTQKEDSEED